MVQFELTSACSKKFFFWNFSKCQFYIKKNTSHHDVFNRFFGLHKTEVIDPLFC